MKPDGSSVSSTETKYSNGSKTSTTTERDGRGNSGSISTTTDAQGNVLSRSGSGRDSEGNRSTTTSSSDGKGNTTITTTTTDSEGNTTVHSSTTDSNGDTTDDHTDEYDKDNPDNPASGGDDSGGAGMPSDDGTDEGPPGRPRGRAGQLLDSLTAKELGARWHGIGDEDDDIQPNESIRDLLAGIAIANSEAGTGWGDAGEEGPRRRPVVDVIVPSSRGATDDWGDLNNPRALIALIDGLATAAMAINDIDAQQVQAIEVVAVP